MRIEQTRMQKDGPMNVLVIDVGGTHVKTLSTGETKHRKFDSGPALTAAQMVEGVKTLTADWTYDAVSIGYPGPVIHGQPVADPINLGIGWVGFDFSGRSVARSSWSTTPRCRRAR